MSTVPARNLIRGLWSSDGVIEESVNPSTGGVEGRYVSAGRSEGEAAIAAARAAFESTDWSRSALWRARALTELADRLAERASDLARTLSREGGKLLAQTTYEVALSIEVLRYSAALARVQVAGRNAEPEPGQYFFSAPEALGVAGIIVPWNSPIALLTRALGPALGAGCTAVVKMPGQTALTNALFAQAVATTSLLPAGVVNVLTEAGNEVAPLLAESPGVDVISYTGSTRVGRLIAAAAAPTLKRVNLELGGKTPLIVFDDVEVDTVIPHLIGSSITMNGQFCVTGSRVLVQRGIADEVRAKLAAGLEAVVLGPADDLSSQLGPLIDPASVQRLDRFVDDAAGYAKVVVRGGPPRTPEPAGGSFFRPALLEVERLDVPAVQEELFGPIQTFEIFDDEDDAIRRANATEYGLAAAVFTTDHPRARRVGRELRAGAVWTNTWGVLTEHFENAGDKQSGLGSLGGPAALSEFQKLKVYAGS